jgi:PAS domain S-box-containing protein
MPAGSISEYQQLELALRDSEEHFRLLAASVRDYAIIMLDSEGRVASWNIGAERIKGYAASEIIDRHFSVFYTPEDLELELPERALALARTTGKFTAEGLRVRKDGSRFLAYVVITPLQDNSGTLRGYAKVIRDVSTHRRFAERFRLVVESAPNAMVMIDSAGHIEMVNTQAERVFGYSRAELLGQPVEILVPARFRNHHAGLRAIFFAAPQSRPMGEGRDLFGRRKDGSEFPIEIGLNPIETEEGAMVLSAIVDISDRKHKEQKIEAALEEKNILLGEIHHRVKNNLQIVHSLLDLQAARIEDPTLLDILKDSQNRIRAMALIHQTLYQSKNFAQIDFSEVLNSLVPTLVESYGVNQNKINYTIDVDTIFLSINAAIPCGLVVNELISNALKHAFPSGSGGTIAIILRQEGDQIFLSISDDGVGIPAHLDLEKTETLGLQLITLLASQLGAELSIQRAAPTRFLLRFPANR